MVTAPVLEQPAPTDRVNMKSPRALPPAIVVHALADARAVLARGEPVTLLSPPGAALYAGCGWWHALIEMARAAYPETPCTDILDCADGTGLALAAARIGLRRLVLWPKAPGRPAVVAIVEAMGGFVLPASPSGAAVATRGGRNGDKPPPKG
jgi:hypothetical protein